MADHTLWAMHQAFEDILSRMESGKISRARIAEVVQRLMLGAPEWLSQADVARGRRMATPTDLPADSVSRATAALAGLALLTQHPPRDDRPGRPYTPLQLGGPRWAMIGVKIGYERGRAVTFDILATGLDCEPLELPIAYQSPAKAFRIEIGEDEDIVESLAASIEELCDLPVLRNRAILGVGVEVSGHVDRGDVIASSVQRLEGTRLGLELSRRLDGLANRLDRDYTSEHRSLPVIIDNDVNVLAAWETYNLRFPEHDVAVVSVFDDGIGAGLIMGNEVYRGGRGMAGEIGHCLIPLNPLDVAKISPGVAETKNQVPSESSEDVRGFLDACRCDHRNHLDCLTPARILAELGERDIHKFDEVAHRPAKDADGNLTSEGWAFQIAGQGLGDSLATLINMINPSLILLFLPPVLYQAEAGTSAERYQQRVRNTLIRHAFSSARETTLLIEPLADADRYFRGAQAASLRVLDSFVRHAKRKCRCYDPREAERGSRTTE